MLKKINLKKATKILKNIGEEVSKKNALHVIKDEDNALNLLQATDDFLLEGSLNNWSINDDYLKVTVNGEVGNQAYDLFNDDEIKEFKDVYNSINGAEPTSNIPDMNSKANEWQKQQDVKKIEEINKVLDENIELVNNKFNSNVNPNQTWTPDGRPLYNSTQKEVENYIDIANGEYNPDDHLEALDGSYYAPEGGYFEKQEVEAPIIDSKKVSTDAAEEAAKETIEQVTDDLADTTGQKKVVRNRIHSVTNALDPDQLSKFDMANAAFSVIGAVSTYKSARREGHGVVSSTVRAGLDFAQGELLGFWGNLGVGLVKTIPSVAIAGTEMLYKESRRMNSAANAQVFGGAQFADNQQLATMRQSGMEMAKMAQYNLQQTLMGNEATYLHR